MPQSILVFSNVLFTIGVSSISTIQENTINTSCKLNFNVEKYICKYQNAAVVAAVAASSVCCHCGGSSAREREGGSRAHYRVC